MADLEAVRRARGAQQVHIALAAATEAEVVTHEQVTHREAVDEQVLHDGVGAEGGEAFVEGQQQHPIHAGSLEQRELLAQARQPRRNLATTEILARLRFEGHDHGGQLEARRDRAQRLEQRTVPAMDPVEVADRRDAAPMARAQIVHAANDFHGPADPDEGPRRADRAQDHTRSAAAPASSLPIRASRRRGP